MSRKLGKAVGDFFQETRLIFAYAGQVWRLIPRAHKTALLVAGGLMALVSVCNTALPLLLGQLVDRIKVGLDDELPSHKLYRIAALFLCFIAAAYLLREVLNVLRRYLVENS